LEAIGYVNSIYIAVQNIDLGRKGFAIVGKEREGRISYETGIAQAMLIFQEVSNLRFEASADPQALILAEYAFITQEFQLCDKDDNDSLRSLTKAIESFDDAFLAIKAVEGSCYKAVELAIPHNGKFRVKGLPKDAFHIACNSHKTRIKNILKSPVFEYYLYSPQPLHVDAVMGFVSLHFLQTQVSPMFRLIGIFGEGAVEIFTSSYNVEPHFGQIDTDPENTVEHCLHFLLDRLLPLLLALLVIEAKAASSFDTTRAPIGNKTNFAIRQYTIPNGIPIMVTKKTIANAKYKIVNTNPIGNHIIFNITETTLLNPDTFSFPYNSVSRIITLPNGRADNFANSRHALATGSPIIVIAKISAAINHPIAFIAPPNINQRILPIKAMFFLSYSK
jgi:hypothetical protein